MSSPTNNDLTAYRVDLFSTGALGGEPPYSLARGARWLQAIWASQRDLKEHQA